MSYKDHALREFKALGYDPIEKCEEDPNKWIQENVLELLEVFSNQGHSGFSAPYAVEMFAKLAMFKPLGPLTGSNDEWNVIDDLNGVTTYQNNRCSHVFKENDKAYDIDGLIFRDKNGVCYTNKESRVYITFPYTPKSEYVDVDDSKLIAQMVDVANNNLSKVEIND